MGPDYSDCNGNMEEARFLAWLQISMAHAVRRMAVKHRTHRDRELLILDQPIVSKDGISENTYVENLPNDNIPTTEKIEFQVTLEQAFTHLTPRQRQVILESVIEGYPISEVAQRMGISHQRACRLKKRALEKLRQLLI